MKRCPQCGTQYPDEANFCPTDACRLETVAADSAPAAADPRAGPDRAPTTVDEPTTVGETTPAADGDDRATDVSPVIAGRFRLDARLGGDRTGDVFDATDMSDGGPCVVKTVAAAVFGTPLLLHTAERELAQLAQLRAPGAAQVIAHGRQGERLWIASEKVGGTALDDLVAARGALEPGRAIEVAVQVASALAEAARFGVIHRDLAPKNVLVGEDGSASIINFAVPVSLGGKVPGVPEFTAPEQIEGRAVDQRSNIYSLGALLYFCATGAPPYTGDVESVRAQHLSGQPPPPPSSRAPVSASFDALVLKALERSSSRRYMTMRQLARELEQLAGSPASTRPMGRAGVQAANGSRSGAKRGKGKSKAMAETLLGVPPVDGGKAGAGLGAVAPTSADAALGLRRSSAALPAERLRQDEVGAAPARADHAVRPAAVIVEDDAPQMNREDIVASTTDPNEQPNQSASPAPAQGEGASQSAAPAPPAAANPAPPTTGRSTAPAGGKGKKRRSGRRTGKKGGFRETMWFKKGALDEKAAAEAAAAGSKEGDAPVSDKADELPIEDRYNDDGSLTSQDQSKFSLRTGSTQMVPAMRDGGFGGNVSEKDLVSEMRGGRGKIIALIIIAILVVTAVVAYLTA